MLWADNSRVLIKILSWNKKKKKKNMDVSQADNLCSINFLDWQKFLKSILFITLFNDIFFTPAS